MARLLVLWLLAERPLTGYEIKKSLTAGGMAFWFGLEDGSIYSVLRTLTKHGLADVVGIEHEGNRPARTRYRITPQGRQHYRSLLIEALRTPALPVSPIDVALAARGDLEPTVVAESLAARSKALHELAAEIDAGVASAPSPAIAERNRSIIDAELDWLAELDQQTIT